MEDRKLVCKADYEAAKAKGGITHFIYILKVFKNVKFYIFPTV